jgi:hypothetical protein
MCYGGESAGKVSKWHTREVNRRSAFACNSALSIRKGLAPTIRRTGSNLVFFATECRTAQGLCLGQLVASKCVGLNGNGTYLSSDPFIYPQASR